MGDKIGLYMSMGLFTEGTVTMKTFPNINDKEFTIEQKRTH